MNGRVVATRTGRRAPTVTPPRASVGQFIESGADAAAALEFYRAVFGAQEFAFGQGLRPDAPSRFGFRYRSTGDGRVSLRTSTLSVPSQGVLAPSRQYVLAWSVEGNVTIDPDRDDAVALRPGIPVMLPADRPFRIVAGPGTIHFVHFDADFVEAVAVIGIEAAPMPLAFPVTVPPDLLAPLRTVLGEVAGPMLDVEVTDGQRAELDLRLAEAMLRSFRPAPDGVRPAAALSTLERAKAFMHAHFDQTLLAADIAAAADVSLRTLQEAFQHGEGSTPMTSLRDLRLEKVRLGLQLADARETSVATIAYSCGFRHMGRFSGAYHRAYGEYPGDTLRGPRRLIAVAATPDRSAAEPAQPAALAG